jgi:hypothetical protein
MFTSAVMVALLGVAGSSNAQNPTWMTEYATAQKTAKEQGKPLAVFLGAGTRGWNKLSQTGKLTEEALRVLASDYTCLFVDTKQSAGRELAEAFDIKEGLGLVISSRTGDLQAFYHAGDLADETLVGYLRQFADPNLIVRTTVTNPAEESEPEPTYRYRPVYRNFSFRSC